MTVRLCACKIASARSNRRMLRAILFHVVALPVGVLAGAACLLLVGLPANLAGRWFPKLNWFFISQAGVANGAVAVIAMFRFLEWVLVKPSWVTSAFLALAFARNDWNRVAFATNDEEREHRIFTFIGDLTGIALASYQLL